MSSGRTSSARSGCDARPSDSPDRSTMLGSDATRGGGPIRTEGPSRRSLRSVRRIRQARADTPQCRQRGLAGRSWPRGVCSRGRWHCAQARSLACRQRRRRAFHKPSRQRPVKATPYLAVSCVLPQSLARPIAGRSVQLQPRLLAPRRQDGRAGDTRTNYGGWVRGLRRWRRHRVTACCLKVP